MRLLLLLNQEVDSSSPQPQILGWPSNLLSSTEYNNVWLLNLGLKKSCSFHWHLPGILTPPCEEVWGRLVKNKWSCGERGLANSWHQHQTHELDYPAPVKPLDVWSLMNEVPDEIWRITQLSTGQTEQIKWFFSEAAKFWGGAICRNKWYRIIRYCRGFLVTKKSFFFNIRFHNENHTLFIIAGER